MLHRQYQFPASVDPNFPFPVVPPAAVPTMDWVFYTPNPVLPPDSRHLFQSVFFESIEDVSAPAVVPTIDWVFDSPNPVLDPDYRHRLQSVFFESIEVVAPPAVVPTMDWVFDSPNPTLPSDYRHRLQSVFFESTETVPVVPIVPLMDWVMDHPNPVLAFNNAHMIRSSFLESTEVAFVPTPAVTTIVGRDLFRPCNLPTGLQAFWMLDEQPTNVLTAQGSGTQEAGTFKFGSSSYRSASINGNGVSLPATEQFRINNHDWTFECFVRFDDTSTGGNNQFLTLLGAGTQISWQGAAQEWIIDVSGGTQSYPDTLIDDTWYYIQVTCVNERIYFYRGTSGTASQLGTPFFTNGAVIPVQADIGGFSGTNTSVVGYIDEVRYSSKARSFGGSSVVIPTSPFTADIDTLLLLHFEGTGTAFVDDSSSHTTLTDTWADGSTNNNHLSPRSTSATHHFVPWTHWAGNEAAAMFSSSGLDNLKITDASQSGLDITGPFSLSVWIKPEAAGADQMIYDKRGLAPDEGISFLCSFNTAGLGLLKVIINGVTISSDTFPDAFREHRWYHAAVVYDGAHVTFYLAEYLLSTHAHAVDPITTVNDVALGQADGGGNGLRAAIKDVGVWDRALTDSEVKSLAIGFDAPLYTTRPNDTRFGSGRVAYWKLDEKSTATESVTWVDSQGANDLTENVAAVSSGRGYIPAGGVKIGGAADRYLKRSITASDSFDWSAGVFSVGGWIRVTSLAAENPIFTARTSATQYVYARVQTNGVLLLEVVDTSVVVTLDAGPASAISANTWYHVLFVEDGDSWKIYLDGQEVTNGAITDNSRLLNYTDEFRLGASFENTALLSLAGDISDFAVWRAVALSDDQIEILASGRDVNIHGFINYYRMNSAATVTEPDDLGSNNLLDITAGIDTGIGQVGAARDLEASSSEYFEAADLDPGIAQSNRFWFTTYAAWVKQESIVGFPSLVNHIIDTESTAGPTSNALSLAAGTLDPVMASSGHLLNASTTALSPILTGVFAHVTGVHYGAENQVFTDSVRVAVPPAQLAGYLLRVDNPLRVGANSTPAATFDGLVDEVVTFSRSMTDEEVKAMFLKGRNSREAISTEMIGVHDLDFMIMY